MLVLTRKYHEKIRIGDDIVITVLRMKGKSVRLGIEAPDTVSVLRGELAFDKDAPAAESTADDAEETAPKVRNGAPPATRLPATDWTQNAKPQAAGKPNPGHDAESIVLHERVPRRRLSQMMPPILGCNPSKTV